MTVAIPTNNHGAIVLPADSESAANQLIVWARAAEAAFALAEQMCASRFVPAAYRNKPIEGAAAIMAGAEVGLSPMASMRAFDDIQGTPAPKAITLRAIVQSHGHDIVIRESSDRQAVIAGRRKGDTEWQTCTWTLDRATRAGYPKKNPNWVSNPAAMLVARATSEVCRWVASDAIMGMPYSAEEIYDQGLSVESRPAPRRVTAADILDEPATVEAASSVPVEMIRAEQRNRMFALWTEIGYSGDENRDQRLVIIGKVLGLNGPVESSNDLTAEQADTVIAALEAKRNHLRAAAASVEQAADEEPVSGDES